MNREVYSKTKSNSGLLQTWGFIFLFFILVIPTSAWTMGWFPDETSCGTSENPTIGDATINEVYSLGNTHFVEIKIFDPEIDPEDLRIQICYPDNPRGNECIQFDDFYRPVAYPYYVVDLGNNILQLQNNNQMDIILYQEEYRIGPDTYYVYDYLSVNGYDHQDPRDENCDFGDLDTDITTTSNIKGIERSPDGTGDWKQLDRPGNNGEPTYGNHNEGMGIPEIDHFRIEHPAEVLTCQSANITIRACIDENCTEEFADPTTVTFSIYAEDTGDLVSSNMYTFTGNIDLPLRHTTAETLYLRLENPSIEADNNLSCSNQQCQIKFVDSGLLIEIPDNAPAYSSVEGTIKAVRADPNNPESCAEYDGFLGERTINFDFEYINPANGSNFPELNGESLPDGIELDFGANAEANFEISYEDAGEIKLHADYTGEIGSEEEGLELVTLEATGNREIVFYPTHFRIKAYKDEDGSPGEELVYGEDPNNSPKWVAGQPFFMLIEAGVLGEDNVLSITPNFQTTNLQLATSWAGPAPPVGEEWIEVGILEVDNFTMTSGSHLLGEDGPGQQIDEVGAFHVTITAPETYLGISDFLENKIIKDSTDDWSNTEAGIGRFYPHHFELTQGDLTNRVERNCDPASNFTYLGENLEFTYTLTAKNAAEDPTKNYIGDFAKFNGTGAVPFGEQDSDYTVAAIDEESDTPLNNRLDLQSFSMVTPWDEGVAEFKVKLHVKRADPEDGPFDNAIFGVSVMDSDDVSIADFDLDADVDGTNEHIQAAPGTILRYGRISLENAHGSELLDLNVPMNAEYFKEGSFRKNTDDTCTEITPPLVIYDIQPALDSVFSSSDICVIDTGSPGNSGIGCELLGETAKQFSSPPDNGDFNLWFAAPGAGKTGSFMIEADVPDFLQYDWKGEGDDNPTARATFGIYKGNERIIYLRETTWR
jgi:MSHA biogenesis protein MshQ